MRIPAFVLALSVLLNAAGSLAAQGPQPARHPLDGLTSAEYWLIYDVLHDSGKTDSTTKYVQILLREPPKAEVLAWKPGQPFSRQATVYLKQGRTAVEAVVDLNGRKLVSWNVMPGMQASMVWSEMDLIDDLMKHDPQVIAALNRRGITDLNLVDCGGTPPGYFDLPEQRGHRVYRGQCRYLHGVYNGEARQIEGLIAYVDVDEKKILRVSDAGDIPVPTGNHDYTEEAIGRTRDVPTPIIVSQPMGPSFTRNGSQISWQNWSFQVRIDPRSGPLVSLVRYQDGNRSRSVLYQGSLSEIFVPYMDPAEGWYVRNFLDLGEFNHDGLMEPLQPGTDCPVNAAYFNTVVVDEHGKPRMRHNVACLFERATGDMAWRHGSEGGFGFIESRPRRDLVLRAVAVLGNYDYCLDWIFRQDGSIGVAVGATGMIEVKAAGGRMVALDQGGRADPASAEDRYGRFVDEHVVGVNHDHYFSFRLDLDVDGPANSLIVDRLVTEQLPPDHPRKSVWVVQSSTPRTEQQAMLDMSMHEPALWRIANPTERGRLGYPSSYEIKPDHNAMSLMLPDDWPQRRAGFIAHQLWVTPYDPSQRFAAGDYPVLSTPGQGLPAWTAANRPIENTDIVAWYTLGFHHVPRAEDWPVMPVAWHTFEIRPFDFFARNPALDLPVEP